MEKSAGIVPAEATIADRRNVVFTGTTISYGRGKAVATGTGMATEFGKIAQEVSAVSVEPTPLERRTGEIGRWLGIIAVAVCVVTVLASVARAWIGGTLDVQLALTMSGQGLFAQLLAQRFEKACKRFRLNEGPERDLDTTLFRPPSMENDALCLELKL